MCPAGRGVIRNTFARHGLPERNVQLRTSSSMLAWHKLHAMHPWCGPRRRCCRRSTGNFVKTTCHQAHCHAHLGKGHRRHGNPVRPSHWNAPGQPGKSILHTLQAPKACIGQISRKRSSLGPPFHPSHGSVQGAPAWDGWLAFAVGLAGAIGPDRKPVARRRMATPHRGIASSKDERRWYETMVCRFERTPLHMAFAPAWAIAWNRVVYRVDRLVHEPDGW